MRTNTEIKTDEMPITELVPGKRVKIRALCVQKPHDLCSNKKDHQHYILYLNTTTQNQSP
jgi:hypothetical protein